MKKVSLIAILLILLLPNATFAAYDYNSKEFQSIISKLDMQGHSDDDYSTCKVKQVYYEEVLEALNQGKTGEEILQSYVDEYGQAALKEPIAEGSGIIAWTAPALGFLAGAFIVGFGIKRLTNKKAHVDSTELEDIPEIEREIMERTFEEERRKHF